MDNLDRYSNTLLVSLNNRISIREAAAIKEVEMISLAVEPLVTSQSGSDMGSTIESLPNSYNTVVREFVAFPCCIYNH
jgi:hypothetical protein